MLFVGYFHQSNAWKTLTSGNVMNEARKASCSRTISVSLLPIVHANAKATKKGSRSNRNGLMVLNRFFIVCGFKIKVVVMHIMLSWMDDHRLTLHGTKKQIEKKKIKSFRRTGRFARRIQTARDESP